MHLPEQRVILHLYVWQYVQVWENDCTRYLLTQHWMNLSFSRETLTNNKQYKYTSGGYVTSHDLYGRQSVKHNFVCLSDGERAW